MLVKLMKRQFGVRGVQRRAIDPCVLIRLVQTMRVCVGYSQGMRELGNIAELETAGSC